jgi:glucosyl-dolichyl phosphate glucuronosyltransferase
VRAPAVRRLRDPQAECFGQEQERVEEPGREAHVVVDDEHPVKARGGVRGEELVQVRELPAVPGLRGVELHVVPRRRQLGAGLLHEPRQVGAHDAEREDPAPGRCVRRGGPQRASRGEEAEVEHAVARLRPERAGDGPTLPGEEIGLHDGADGSVQTVVGVLRVAVCTNRPPAAVRGCLRALAADGAGDDVLLVSSGLTDSEAAAHEAALAAVLPAATGLREAVPGLSAARNRALAACGEDDLVAFVDDDAEVVPGYRSALAAAWAEEGPRTGCLGGPVHARFPAGRPDWLGDAVVPMLTALDLGPAPLVLDPSRQALAGANLSFRVAAIRAAGGFDPRWGHAGARTWFGEDDEAQLALARLGYAIRYVPGPAVLHMIPPARTRPRTLLSRRFRHGATVARRGRRSPALAARWLASNALLAPVALLRGDRRRAMERLLHASENLGVLLSRWVAR